MDYKESIKQQIKNAKQDLACHVDLPVTKANEKRQVEIKQQIQNLKQNLKKDN